MTSMQTEREDCTGCSLQQGSAQDTPEAASPARRGFGYGWEIFMDMMAPLIRRAPYMRRQGAAHDLILGCPARQTAASQMPLLRTGRACAASPLSLPPALRCTDASALLQSCC